MNQANRQNRHRLLILVRLTCWIALPAFAGLVAGQAPEKPATGFAGDWETSYGPMTLSQNGDRVQGAYLFGGARCPLEGRVDGGRLAFTYHEPSVTGQGWFELSADGLSFSGQWRAQKTDPWQPWTGRRSGRAARGRSPFAGLWGSRYGRIRLVADGPAVRGCYAAPDGSSPEGTLEGAVSQGRLTFRYREESARGEGWFELSADGQSFTGQWRASGAEAWQEWNGTRVKPEAGRKWLVVIEAYWEPRLGEREYSFGSMLKTYFTRTPAVRVRHRFFRDEADLRCWLKEVAFLPEPAVVVVSSHGQAEGIPAAGSVIGPAAFAESLRYADNVQLLHFASCLTLGGRFGPDLLTRQDKAVSYPLSGYATSVDWGASAVLEFLYYDLILARDLAPEEAFQQLKPLAPFSGDAPVPGAPFASLGFRFLPAAAR